MLWIYRDKIEEWEIMNDSMIQNWIKVAKSYQECNLAGEIMIFDA